MSLYGLEVFSASGNVLYSSNDVTWCQVDFFLAEANTTTTKTYPIISGKTVQLVQMLINPPPTDRKAIAHTLSRSGTEVTVSGGSELAYILVLMR